MDLIVKMAANLETMTADELEALNQDMGRYIDSIREYRRTINAAHSAKVLAERATVETDATIIPVEPLEGGVANG